MASTVKYTYQCKQQDGSLYTRKARLSKAEAIQDMASDRKLFSKCSDWKIVEAQ